MGALPRQRTCAVCACERRRLLFEQRFSAMSGGLLTGYDVVVCEACGFAYADGLPEQEAFDAYYRDMSKYEFAHHGGEESTHDLVRFKDIAALVTPYIQTPHARIADIGCANARLLSLLKDSGFGEVLGVDPSPRCAEAAERLYGVPVVTGALSDLPVAAGTADFLILVGVLEHVRDLRPALSSLGAALSGAGRLFVEVPDATRFGVSQNAPFQEFSIEHINFFSPVSLVNLMRWAGFVPLHVERNVRVPGPNTVEPAISAIFEKRLPLEAEIVPDTECGPQLGEYVRRSRELDDSIRLRIDALVARGAPIVVWGVGTHTQRLMATSQLSQANIVAFVDSNPRYHGREIHGVPVVSPQDLRGRPEPVLISSRLYQGEIARYMREDLGIGNEIVYLYSLPEAVP